MTCTPTRLELSNTDATSVDVTLTTDPGDGTAVVLEVPGLSIVASADSSGSAVSYTIAAQTASTNSLWDGTIQVGANAPAEIVVQIVETSAAQTIGLTLTDAEVTYCAPLAGGGVESLDDLSDVILTSPSLGNFLRYNGTDWRNVNLLSSDLPAIELNDLSDVTIAKGSGNDGDLIFFDYAAGAGARFKGVARSSIGLSEFNDDLAAVQDSYLMLIESPSDKTYIIDGRVAAGRTVTNFYAKTSSGTCTATLKNVTDTTTIGTISVTSTGGSAASLTNTSVTENERLSIEISSNSSAADLELVVEYTQ